MTDAVKQIDDGGRYGAAETAFTEYFVRNYPGPETVIYNPNWHAPKLFAAAFKAIEGARLSSITDANPSEDALKDAYLEGWQDSSSSDVHERDREHAEAGWDLSDAKIAVVKP